MDGQRDAVWGTWPSAEEPLTHAFNRTIMVSWLPNCPFEMWVFAHFIKLSFLGKKTSGDFPGEALESEFLSRF